MKLFYCDAFKLLKFNEHFAYFKYNRPEKSVTAAQLSCL